MAFTNCLNVMATFAFETGAQSVGEDAGAATVTVTRPGSVAATQTVAYATTPGTAGEADFTGASGTLTFAPGDATETFSVPIAGDAADEPAETIGLAVAIARGHRALVPADVDKAA